MRKPYSSKTDQRRRSFQTQTGDTSCDIELGRPEQPFLPPVVLHKPYGVLSQFTDSQQRPTLSEWLDLPGLYPVGRLDMDSEGLLILAPKGPIHLSLTTPGGCQKTYWAQVEGLIDCEATDRLQRGVNIAGQYRTRPAKARLLNDPHWPERSVPIRFRKSIPTSWVELTIEEGKNRQVRQMTAAVGFPTLRLIRVSVGPIQLGTLAVGKHRVLTAAELQWLKNQVRDR